MSDEQREPEMTTDEAAPVAPDADVPETPADEAAIEPGLAAPEADVAEAQVDDAAAEPEPAVPDTAAPSTGDASAAPAAAVPLMDEGPAEPAAARQWRGFVAALVLMIVIAMGVALAVLPITIDGSSTWVRRGTTVADLLQAGRLAGTPGDLMSVKGHVVRVRGGKPAPIRVDGQLATTATVLGFGSHVSTAHGADVVEPVTTKTVDAPPPLRYAGHGPVESVEDSGTSGTVELVLGAMSGEEASRRVVTRGQPMIVRREPAWPGRKEVALTFDDGPWPKSTDAILAQLVAAHVKATFFEIGRQVKQRPEITRRIVSAGMEIGDHSYSHKYLATYSHKVIESEIAGGMKALEAATGRKPVWYRPAGGSTNAFVFREAHLLKLRVVLWTIDPKDWKRPGTSAIVRRVLDKVRPGSVILMHDGGGDRSQSVAALAKILKALKARHYAMVTLSRLYRLPGAKP